MTKEGVVSVMGWARSNRAFFLSLGVHTFSLGHRVTSNVSYLHVGGEHCMKLGVGVGKGNKYSGTVLVNTVDFLK